MTKIIIDTSALITALLSSKRSYIHDILDSVIDRQVMAFTSNEICSEIRQVFNKVRIQKALGVRASKAKLFLDQYISICECMTPNVKVSVCRDPNDNMFLELAETAEADYIISVDEDLLVLQEYKETLIVRPYEYMELQKYSYKRQDLA